MDRRTSLCRGCLLGLAVGDAMGQAVDNRTWEDIRRDYGPDGLMGYDLVNGFADVTSHTQVAAFVANGLLLGMTRSLFLGRTAPIVRYVEIALREWAKGQFLRRTPDEHLFWVSQAKELCRRRCMDNRMLETLLRPALGTADAPINQSETPGALTAAVSVGLYYDPARMAVGQIGPVAAQSVALTHGDPMAFLAGAVVAYVIAGILQDAETPLREQFLQAIDAVEGQFGKTYPQASALKRQLHKTVKLTGNTMIPPREAMQMLRCGTCSEVLSGAVYACLACREDFDAAVILAVNHSGRSAAVGALTGAFLGAKMGEAALPDFYLDCLEPAALLRELADDLSQGLPGRRSMMFFDDTWEQKYVHGRRVDASGLPV